MIWLLLTFWLIRLCWLDRDTDSHDPIWPQRAPIISRHSYRLLLLAYLFYNPTVTWHDNVTMDLRPLVLVLALWSFCTTTTSTTTITTWPHWLILHSRGNTVPTLSLLVVMQYAPDWRDYDHDHILTWPLRHPMTWPFEQLRISDASLSFHHIRTLLIWPYQHRAFEQPGYFWPIFVPINSLWPHVQSTDQTIWADCTDLCTGLIQRQSDLLMTMTPTWTSLLFLHPTMPWLTTQVPFSALLPWGDCWLPPGDWIWLARTRQTPHWNVTLSGARTLCPDKLPPDPLCFLIDTLRVWNGAT